MNAEEKKLLHDIKDALIGDDMGNEGLVTRLKRVEQYIENDRRFKAKVAGGVLVLSFVGSAVIWGLNWLFGK